MVLGAYSHNEDITEVASACYQNKDTAGVAGAYSHEKVGVADASQHDIDVKVIAEVLRHAAALEVTLVVVDLAIVSQVINIDS